MYCCSGGNIPFWGWLKGYHTFNISITCKDFHGKHLHEIQLNNVTVCAQYPGFVHELQSKVANDKAGVVIHASAAHTPLPIKYNRSYPLTNGYCLTLTTRQG
jgi:hypothetical protein